MKAAPGGAERVVCVDGLGVLQIGGVERALGNAGEAACTMRKYKALNRC